MKLTKEEKEMLQKAWMVLGKVEWNECGKDCENCRFWYEENACGLHVALDIIDMVD